MEIAAVYSFNRGKEVMEEKHKDKLEEIHTVIAAIDAEKLITKESKESRRNYEMLYNPVAMNNAFKSYFALYGWKPVRVDCDYPTTYYTEGYRPSKNTKGSFREMDFVKKPVGIEVQFGKYAFMVYNVAAKMTIFHKLGFIDVGVEIVPVKELALKMSSGVSYFEQFAWDLEHRGVSNIDIPVLILGITSRLKRTQQDSPQGQLEL